VVVSENRGVFLGSAIGAAIGSALAAVMVLDVGPAVWGLLPLLAWVAHSMVDMIMRELGTYLHAQQKVADRRLREATRHLDDEVARIIDKVEADFHNLPHPPIEVEHAAVNLSGSCVAVR
jgi:hypothetical protein